MASWRQRLKMQILQQCCGVRVTNASAARVEGLCHAGVNRIFITAMWTTGFFNTDVLFHETYRTSLIRCEERNPGRVEQPTHFGMFRIWIKDA